MKKGFFSIILISSFLFSACTKFGKNIGVSGFVINPITGQGISDFEIQLHKIDAGTPGGNKIVRTVLTDGQGYFEIEKLGAINDYYVVANTELFAVGWYDGSSYIDQFEMRVTKGKKMNLEYHAVTKAYSKLIVNNENCEGSADKFVLYRSNDINSFDPSFGWTLDGCDGYESSFFVEVPMGNIYYRWDVTKGGQTQSYYDTVYYNEGEIKYYTINY